jgi:hypothetical protein
MKYLKRYKIFESSGNPIPRYPVDKCLDLLTVAMELEKLHGIDLSEVKLSKEEAEGSKYRTGNFYRWVGDNFIPVFPIPTLSDVYYEKEKKKYAKVGMPTTKCRYFEREAVYELPEHYDSSKDFDNWHLKISKFKADMEKISGKPWDNKNDQHINFGTISNEWVNRVLDKIHELYPQYYKDGKIRIWNDDDYYDRGKQIYDYPLNKSYFLSDLEEWIKDFEIDTTGFLKWILQCQCVEGRYWMRDWPYDIEDVSFRRNVAPDNIKQINELLRQIYKTQSINIFIDYYQKFTEKEEKEIYD